MCSAELRLKLYLEVVGGDAGVFGHLDRLSAYLMLWACAKTANRRALVLDEKSSMEGGYLIRMSEAGTPAVACIWGWRLYGRHESRP